MTGSLLTATMYITVYVASQKLVLTREGHADKTWPVSTSHRGTGMTPGSGKTPIGNFRIYQKIGGSEPIYTIFENRRPVGRWDPRTPPCNKVLTRIMWLDGLDAANKNTLSRAIYIHGTSNESHVGHPYSAGCVTMKNKDVIELFSLVEQNTHVKIVPANSEEIDAEGDVVLTE